MREVLSGWKRKLGVLALLLACVLTTGWVRSSRTVDNLLFVVGKIAIDVESCDGSLDLMLHRIFGERTGRVEYFQRSRWKSRPYPPNDFNFVPKARIAKDTALFSPEFRSWRRQESSQWGGVEIASGGTVINGSITVDRLYTYFLETNNSKMKNRIETRLIGLSYWHLVLPLTLLSAWLLISKPRLRREGGSMSYFNPLRRKLGVVALVLACVSSIGWLRSRSVIDFISYRPKLGAWHDVTLSPNGVKWTRTQGRKASPVQCGLFNIRWESKVFTKELDLQYKKYSRLFDFLSNFESCGFQFCQVRMIGSNVKMETWTIPFWSIVISLTALSGWLLISKSGTQKTSPAT